MNVQLPSGVRLEDDLGLFFNDGISLSREFTPISKVADGDPARGWQMLESALQSVAIKRGFENILYGAETNDPDELLQRVKDLATQLKEQILRSIGRKSSIIAPVRNGLKAIIPGAVLDFFPRDPSLDACLCDFDNLFSVIYNTLHYKMLMTTSRYPRRLFESERMITCYEHLVRLLLEIGQTYLAKKPHLEDPEKELTERQLYNMFSSLMGDHRKEPYAAPELDEAAERICRNRRDYYEVITALYISYLTEESKPKACQRLMQITGFLS